MPKCLNACRECPDRYKESVVKGFLHRTKSLCSEKSEMMLEISRSKQILINNGYSNSMVDNQIKKFLKKEITNTQNSNLQPSTSTNSTTPVTQPQSNDTTPINTIPLGKKHRIFYRNFMNPYYKRDETRLKKIIKINGSLHSRSPNDFSR